MASGLEFGTDGVRDLYGQDPLTVQSAQQLGRATVVAFDLRGANILIAGDTRASSAELTQAIADGVVAMGGNALLLGEFTTPGLALRTRDTCDVMAGIMVTASHNLHSRDEPTERWNGYKVFGSQGDKITDIQATQLIAAYELDFKDARKHGALVDNDELRWQHSGEYLKYLHQAVGERPLLVVKESG